MPFQAVVYLKQWAQTMLDEKTALGRFLFGEHPDINHMKNVTYF
jgi:hypothetical protein